MSQPWTNLKELQEAVKHTLINHLAHRDWTSLTELQAAIPAELAEARCRLSTAACDQLSPSDRQGFGRDRLCAEVVTLLKQHAQCETHTGTNGQEEIRLVQQLRNSDRTDAMIPVPERPPEPPGKTPGSQEPGPHDLPCHPMALLFPDMTAEEYGALKQSIAQLGQQEVIRTHQGQIVDGRHRYRACRELGLVPRLEEWNGPGSPLDCVIAKNLIRRQLEASQRAMVAARLKPLYEEEARARMLAGKAPDPMAHVPQGSARTQAAARLKVSPRSVEQASKVLREGVPELIQAVAEGEVSVSAAAEVAAQPAGEQQQALAGGREAVAAKAKAARAQKAKATQRQDGKKGKKTQHAEPVEAPVEDSPPVDIPILPGKAPDLPGPDTITISRSMPVAELAQRVFALLGREQAGQLHQAFAELLHAARREQR